MSAPTVACAMIEAMAPLLKQLTASLGAKASMQYFPASHTTPEFWSVMIWDHDACFAGDDMSDPVRALLKANEKRQAYTPALVRAA